MIYMCKKINIFSRQQLPPIDKVIGVSIDHEQKLFLTYTEDMLLNTLKRDAVKIASSFDKLCEGHIKEISRLVSTTLMIIDRGKYKASQDKDELTLACLEMLANAINSFSAATTILRNGYRLQPGILIRNILETISTVLHLLIYKDDLGKFRKGHLKSSKTIDSAKQVLSPFGEYYGFFSQEFAHIGNLQQNLHPLTSYNQFDDALKSNIAFLRLTSWLLYVTTELICYKTVNNHRYWQDLGESDQGHMYAYNPSEDERQWLANYLVISESRNW